MKPGKYCQLLDLPTLTKAKSDLHSVMDISGLVRYNGKVKFRSDLSTSITELGI